MSEESWNWSWILWTISSHVNGCTVENPNQRGKLIPFTVSKFIFLRHCFLSTHTLPTQELSKKNLFSGSGANTLAFPNYPWIHFNLRPGQKIGPWEQVGFKASENFFLYTPLSQANHCRGIRRNFMTFWRESEWKKYFRKRRSSFGEYSGKRHVLRENWYVLGQSTAKQQAISELLEVHRQRSGHAPVDHLPHSETYAATNIAKTGLNRRI